MIWLRRATLLVRGLAAVWFAAAAGGCGIASGAGQTLGNDIGGSGVATQTHPGRIAHAGTTVGVGGSNGEKLNITVTRIVDPAVGATDFDVPDAGAHFIAVQFRLTNAGSASYNDSPSVEARFVDAKGQVFDSSFADTEAGPSFAGQISVAPHTTELGFVTFEVPDGTTLARVQYATDLGLGQTAEWLVP